MPLGTHPLNVAYLISGRVSFIVPHNWGHNEMLPRYK